jgi:hypothetical protein
MSVRLWRELPVLAALVGCVTVDDFDTLEQEIFVPSCGFSSCHGTGTGDLIIATGETYDALVGVPSSAEPDQVLVVPGDAEASYLVAKLEGRAEVGDAMPPGGEGLDEESLDRIWAWIEAGAEP